MPEGVRRLRALGLEDAARTRGARSFFGIRFFLPSGPPLTLDFRELDPDLYGLIWSRSALDGLLVDFARERGACVLEETTATLTSVGPSGAGALLVRAQDRSASGSCSESVGARLLIGADGAGSRLHRQIGCRRQPVRRRFGVRRRFAGWGGAGDFVDVFFEAAGEAYVAPLGRDSARVTLLLDGDSRSGETPGRRYDRLLEGFPRLSERLTAAERRGPVEAAAPVAQKVLPPAANGVLLVGDAAGSVDPITGQGLTLALHDAQLAAHYGGAFLDGGGRPQLDAYWRARQRVFEPCFSLAQDLLNLFRQPSLASRACRMLASRPSLRRKVLAMATSLPPEPRLSRVDRLRLAVGF